MKARCAGARRRSSECFNLTEQELTTKPIMSQAITALGEGKEKRRAKLAKLEAT